MRLGRAAGALLIPAALAFFLVLGWRSERAEVFRPLRDALRVPAVPTEMLNHGAVGWTLRRLRLVELVPNDQRRYHRSEFPKSSLTANLFQKKRIVGDMLYAPSREWVDRLAAEPELTEGAVPRDQFREGLPLISVWVSEHDLTGRERGIVVNYKRRGQDWERPARVTYYVNGEPVFTTGAGIRLHGGTSRQPGMRHSYRLYFRETYGADRFKPGILFTTAQGPLQRLVVHADWPESHPFAGLLAFDMAERVGCTVPRTQPALFLLNGKSQGITFLSEQVNRKAWVNRVGHRDFLMYIFKGQREKESFRAFRALHQRLLNWPVPMDLATVEKEIDLDTLSAYILSIAYGGTSDDYQGAALLDRRADQPRWTWINWDMDHSFWDVYGDPGQREPWQKESWLRLLVRPGDRRYAAWRAGGDPRTVIFTRLMDESPAFRARFIRYATDMLNHRLTENFMLERIAHYERLAAAFGRADLSFAGAYREFARRRPAVLREGLQQYFNAGAVIHQVQVRAAAGTSLLVDGFEETGQYTGHYFDGQTVSVTLPGRPDGPAGGWLVNGKPAGASAGLVLAADQDLVIEPAPVP